MVCDVPVRMDTYRGCGHGCEYCFAQKKVDLKNIKPVGSRDALKKFIKGERTFDTDWCDFDIPIHWGGLSDPFQPSESIYKSSRDCLEVFADYGYPVIISTKGTLLAKGRYLELLKRANAAVQISMLTPNYDPFEKGAPKFEERLGILETLAKNSRRLIVRLQPYILGIHEEVAKWFGEYRRRGVYGVTIEGMKRQKWIKGFIKLAGDVVYPAEDLKREFEFIREKAHGWQLKFFCAENRLRGMGDDPCCCGVNGLKGFVVNKANMNHIQGGEIEYTERMKEIGTARCFGTLTQKTSYHKALKEMSYIDR